MAARTQANGNPRGLSACQRRAAVERTWHPAPCAASAVRHLCGSGAHGQSAFSYRHASHGRPHGEIHRARRRGTGRGSGRKAAYLAALNGLAVARQHLGSLDKVTRIVRLGVSVATSGDVREQPKIADGASALLQDVFGKDKNPGRLVYGVASLPLGVPVELDLIFEVSA
jgi:enamine deaminase RidA (YjgF/YER057c/UK114 family)